MIAKRKIDELAILDQVARALAQTSDLKEIKNIRDRAEAFRKYAQSAALGQKIQNHAAAMKLRAERRAGELLAGLEIRGGDRRSKARDERLKLADLGIDHNQSARWQREAATPERVFESYIASTTASGKDITAQGLLRLARTLDVSGQNRRAPRNGVAECNGTVVAPLAATTGCAGHADSARANRVAESPDDLFSEIHNHRRLLGQILKPFCLGGAETLRRSEKLLVLRLLDEMEGFIAGVQSLMQAVS
jgi:hypothetical protein